MSLARARIIKNTNADAAATTDADAATHPGAGPRLARRVPRVVVDSRAEAATILAAARAEAEGIVNGAQAAAVAIAEAAAREAREQELARIAAEMLIARGAAERQAEQGLDRAAEIAVLLAERLVGESITLDPARIGALAVEALRETRGARQVRIEACPEDVASLEAILSSLGEGIASVEASAHLGRGSLVVHTELGRVDARLAPQLARLAHALRSVQ